MVLARLVFLVRIRLSKRRLSHGNQHLLTRRLPVSQDFSVVVARYVCMHTQINTERACVLHVRFQEPAQTGKDR